MAKRKPKKAKRPKAPAPPALPPRRAAAMARRLGIWFAENQRPLPWRRSRDPYRVWLSEVLLQQTRVSTALPYYEKFVRRYPTVGRLARAPLDEVLSLWAGLGYYGRARQLHRAAQVVTGEYGGRLPAEPEALQKLPGVGPYTAGAISSIAFGRPEPAVDGNVVRLLSRLEAWSADPADPAARRAAAPLVRAVLERGRPEQLTQALMELGATCCLPAAPLCPSCPLAALCKARKRGEVGRFPKTRPRRRPVALRLLALALERPDGRVLVRRRAEQGLWGGLWELPGAQWSENARSPQRLLGRLAREVGASGRARARLLGSARHTLTHRKLSVALYHRRVTGAGRAGKGYRWIDPAHPPEGLALSRLDRKLLALLNDEG